MGEASSDARTMARGMAAIYGHRLERPIMYTHGVALRERLRLFETGGLSSDPAPEIAHAVSWCIDAPTEAFGRQPGTANYAGVCWAESLFRVTGDIRYSNMFLYAADRVAHAERGGGSMLDPDARVEDFFFASMLLGGAYRLTGMARYAETLCRYLLNAGTQQQEGLWWHCASSPFNWGRGNGFAALGFSEALSCLSVNHPSYSALLKSHVRHIEALRRHQDSSGMWRQVIDEPRSYLEHSATSMIGNAIARGVRLGWLPADWMDSAEKAWDAVSRRTGPEGQMEHVCAGTGPQADLQAYVDRPFTDGQDDRGGAMALYFAVEMGSGSG